MKRVPPRLKVFAAVFVGATTAACGGSSGSSGGGSDSSPPEADAPLPASIEQVFTGLAFPRMTDIQAQPDAAGTERLFVVQKDGTISYFEPGAETPRARPYLDVTGLEGFDTNGEHGLLGLAFDPRYADNGFFYVHLVKADPRRVVIVRFRDDGTPPVDPAKATTVLVADDFAKQPDRTNHVAGGMAFGPADGFLYLTMGDGGGGFDPDDTAQDRTDLTGSILRIDVRGTGDEGGPRNYAIPPDNPYAGNDRGFRDEIFAHGLRNPFRISIERLADSQRVWVADVGQQEREEVNVITAGGNYGWDCREGTRTVEPARASGICADAGDGAFIDPVAEYDHSVGESITGGHVYDGERLAGELSGRYVYGDFVSGRIWAYDAATESSDVLVDTALRIVTFGRGSNGALYIGDFSGGGLYRLAP